MQQCRTTWWMKNIKIKIIPQLERPASSSRASIPTRFDFSHGLWKDPVDCGEPRVHGSAMAIKIESRTLEFRRSGTCVCATRLTTCAKNGRVMQQQQRGAQKPAPKLPSNNWAY